MNIERDAVLDQDVHGWSECEDADSRHEGRKAETLALTVSADSRAGQWQSRDANVTLHHVPVTEWHDDRP